MRLEVPPPSDAVDASAMLFASDTDTATPLRAALPQEATRLVRSRNRMLDSTSELEKLSVMGITLEGSVDSSFRTDGPWKRDEVRKKWRCPKLITLMKSCADVVIDSSCSHGKTSPTRSNLGKAPAFAPPPSDEQQAATRHRSRPDSLASPRRPRSQPSRPRKAGLIHAERDTVRPRPSPSRQRSGRDRPRPFYQPKRRGHQPEVQPSQQTLMLQRSASASAPSQASSYAKIADCFGEGWISLGIFRASC